MNCFFSNLIFHFPLFNIKGYRRVEMLCVRTVLIGDPVQSGLLNVSGGSVMNYVAWSEGDSSA